MTDSPGQRITKAQRRVLEAIAAGAELTYDGLLVAWKLRRPTGRRRVNTNMMHRIRDAGWIVRTPIVVTDRDSLGQVVYALTHAGRAALAREIPRD